MANLKDYATGTVATAPAPATSGTSLTLQSGEGARMPTPPFYATAHPDNVLPTLDNAEKILVTAVSTNTLTIVRAQGGTTARSIAIGWRISNTIFAADMYNGSDVRNEVPGGSINGSNVNFTIAAAFTPGSLNVYLNGQRLKSGSGNDYVELSTLTGFTMQYAPATGDVLLVDYTVGSSIIMDGIDARINQETPSGSVNGSNTAFTTARGYISGSLEVYVNGLLQAKTTHVTETSPSAGTFSLDVAPIAGDIIRVSYQYAVSTGGNAQTVNGIAANTTPTANQLTPLDSNAKVPSSTLPMGVVYARKNGTSSINNATDTTITGWTPSGSDHALFNGSTGIYTATTNCTVNISGSILIRSANSSTTSIRIYKNGATVVGFFDYQNIAAYTVMPFAASAELSIGDTLRVNMSQSSGAARVVHDDPNTIFISIGRVG